MKSAKQECPELKFQIVQGPELTEEEMNGIAMVLAKMIHRQLIKPGKPPALLGDTKSLTFAGIN